MSIKAETLQSLAKEYERMFDSLRRRYVGQDVAGIRPVLQREWARVNGGSISDPELTDYATYISEGKQIKLHT